MSLPLIKVGITQGDINGIGYEVIFKTLQDARIFDMCSVVIYGSSKVAAYHRKALNISNFNLNSIRSGEEIYPKRVNIINCLDDNVRVELGKPTKQSGEAAYLALKEAVADMKNNNIDVLLTAPINKNTIQSEDFNFPGHTEYLEQEFGGKSLMFMVGERFKIGVVSGHIPISEVAASITKEAILEKLRTMNSSLQNDFTIRKPRIAVLGLNPHAGDDGLIGKEEQEIIIPAIEEAKNEGIMAVGPYAADGLFGSGQANKFDAILAMYHDQGLAPFKALEFSKGVNYTAGLPVVRTSPDHGTAFEIAGLNQAEEDSFRRALFLAIDIAKNRRENADLAKDPLKSYDISKMDDFSPSRKDELPPMQEKELLD